MKRKLILIVLALSTLLLPAGCVNHTPIEEGDLFQSQEEAADDIIATPGGLAYRANIYQEGIENPWPPISTTSIEISTGIGVIYRDYIETKAGESRSNIILVSVSEIDGPKSLTLYAKSVPAGFSLTTAQDYGGPFTKAKVIAITVSAEVEPGSYTFKIGLEINGKDYGTIPCTVEVTD